MAANVNIVVNAQDRASGTFRKIRSAFGEILQVALGVRMSQVLDRMGQAIRDFATNSIDAAADLQMFQIGIETLIAREQFMEAQSIRTAQALMYPWQISEEFSQSQINLANNTVEFADALAYADSVSADYIKNLQTIALLSPYQFGDVQKSFRQAMAFGFTAKEAVKFTEATLNVAAGVGASNQQLDRMAYNLAQIRLQGMVTKLDIRQLALAGFDLLSVLQYVGDQTDVNIKTHLDFNDAIKSGKITWADFTKFYAEYSDTYFGGASERMARTLFGLRNTFKDIFAVTMPQILGPTLDAVTEFTSGILDAILELRDSGHLEAWGASIKESFDTKWKPVLDYLLMGEGGPTSDSKLVLTLESIKEFMSGDWMSDTKAESWKLPYMLEKLTGINFRPLLSALETMRLIFINIREGDFLSDFNMDMMGDLLGLDGNALMGVRDTILGIIGNISTIFSSGILSDEGGGALGALLGLDPGTVQTIQQIITNIVMYIGRRFSEISQAVGPIIEAIKTHFLPVILIIIGFLVKIGEYVGKFLLGAFSVITQWFADNSDLVAAWIEIISRVYRNVVVFLGLLITSVVAFLGPILEGVLGFILNIAGAIIAFFDGDLTRAKEMILEAFTALGEGVWNALLQLDEFLLQIWDDYIWPTLEGWIATAVTVGATLMTSIAQGFVDAWGTAKALFQSGIDTVVDFLKNLLGIASPSKLFMEMGAYSMEGFLKGFQPNNLVNAGLTMGVAPNMKALGAGAGGAGVTVINNYNGLTLNDRLQAETLLRPIVQKITR